MVQLFAVCAVFQVLYKVDRSEVADSGFGVRRIQRDLGAEIGGMHHAHMLLGRADIARIFVSNPRVTCFKQHGEHLAPQIGGLHCFMQFELTLGSFLLVRHVSFLKS